MTDKLDPSRRSTLKEGGNKYEGGVYGRNLSCFFGLRRALISRGLAIFATIKPYGLGGEGKSPGKLSRKRRGVWYRPLLRNWRNQRQESGKTLWLKNPILGNIARYLMVSYVYSVMVPFIQSTNDHEQDSVDGNETNKRC